MSCSTPICSARAYTGCIASLPVIQTPPRSSALLFHVNRTLSARSEAALEPLGLRPRHLIALTMLRDQPHIAQQTLATTLQIDRTNLVGLLNELEDLGLISRTRSAQDRRRHEVALTEVGARLLAKAEFALAAVEDEVFALLSHEERETLHALLHRVVAPSVPAAACTGDC